MTVPKWMVKMAETGRPPTMREMGFELEPSMEAYLDALQRGETPSEDMIKFPEDLLEDIKRAQGNWEQSPEPTSRPEGGTAMACPETGPAKSSGVVEAGEPEGDGAGEVGGAEGTDK